MNRYEVWRTSWYGGEVSDRTFSWRWLARLYASERTTRGWFKYRVRDRNNEQEDA